ncbi:MAG TPA: Spy/CpxP family protein refolding chaperone [Kofleriaceae bacterium]|nr:Spy/CpxP family protein refolding chaperone [Kofleriaceae bacterium]
MIALAVGIGLLGIFALRRARRRCFAADYYGYGYTWNGPWPRADCMGGHDEGAAGVRDGEDDHFEPRGEGRHGCGRRGRGFGPPWARGRRGGGRWRGNRWFLHAALSRIDATPAQERAIVGELDKLKERASTVRRSLREVHTDLAAAVRGPLLDDAALGAVLGRVDGATNEVRAAAIDTLRKIHAVLDDEQRAELAEIILDRGSSGTHRRGGTGSGGAGWWRTGPYR